MPWTHLQIEQDGSFRPCCRTLGFRQNRQFDRASYEKSEELNSLKEALLKGDSPKDCQRCWNDEKHGDYSFRQMESQKYPRTTQDLKTMEIRFGNLCNLSCRMCSTAYSSKWIAEVRSASEILVSANNFQRSAGFVTKTYQMDRERLSQFAEWAKDCDEIYLSGGEPFYFPEFKNFISVLKNRTSGNTALFISTNGTFYDKDIFDSLGKFRRVDISVSIEAMGLVNDYIRSGSKWVQIEENLKRFKSHFPKINYVLAPTINIYNVYNLPELLDYCERELKPAFTIKQKFNFQTYPEWQSIEAIPAKMKNAVFEKYNKAMALQSSEETKSLIEAVMDRLKETDHQPKATQDFLLLNSIYDEMKNQRLRDFIPELKQWLEDDLGSHLCSEV